MEVLPRIFTVFVGVVIFLISGVLLEDDKSEPPMLMSSPPTRSAVQSETGPKTTQSVPPSTSGGTHDHHTDAPPGTSRNINSSLGPAGSKQTSDVVSITEGSTTTTASLPLHTTLSGAVGSTNAESTTNGAKPVTEPPTKTSNPPTPGDTPVDEKINTKPVEVTASVTPSTVSTSTVVDNSSSALNTTIKGVVPTEVPSRALDNTNVSGEIVPDADSVNGTTTVSSVENSSTHIPVLKLSTTTSASTPGSIITSAKPSVTLASTAASTPAATPAPTPAPTPTPTAASTPATSSTPKSSGSQPTLHPNLANRQNASTRTRNILVGIAVPLVVIALAIVGFVCYRKRKKSGRGYITLDDFGSFEGMQNPNYDGEL